jgi:hypothetical protein
MDLLQRIVRPAQRIAPALLLVAVPASLPADDKRPVDPRLKIAQAATKTISEAEMRVAQSHSQILSDIRNAFAEVEEALPHLQSNRAERSAEALSGLGKAASGLHRLSSGLLTQETSYRENRDNLKTANEAAVAPYRDAANACRQWSQQATFTDVKAVYLKTAEIWDAQADDAERRAMQFATNEAKIKECIALLREWATYLGHFSDMCEALPDPRTLNSQQVYLDHLKRCVQMIERFKVLISELHEELTAGAVNTALRPTPQPTTPAASQRKDQLARNGRSQQPSRLPTAASTDWPSFRNSGLQSFLSAKRRTAPTPPTTAYLAGGTHRYKTYYGVP